MILFVSTLTNKCWNKGKTIPFLCVPSYACTQYTLI